MAHYEANLDKRTIEIYFESKPSEETQNRLKRNYWSWSSEKQCWYNYFSKSNLDFAKNMCAEKSVIPIRPQRKKPLIKENIKKENIKIPVSLGQKVSFMSRGFGKREGTIINIDSDSKTVVIEYDYILTSGELCKFKDRNVNWENITILQTENVKESLNFDNKVEWNNESEKQFVSETTSEKSGKQFLPGQMVSFESQCFGKREGTIIEIDSFSETAVIEYDYILASGETHKFKDQKISWENMKLISQESDVLQVVPELTNTTEVPQVIQTCNFSIGDLVEYKSETNETKRGKIKSIDYSVETASIVYQYISSYLNLKFDVEDDSIPWIDIKKCTESVPLLEEESSMDVNESHKIDLVEDVYGRTNSGYDAFSTDKPVKNIPYKKYDYEQLSEEKQKEITFNESVKKRIQSGTDLFSEVKVTQQNNLLFKHQKAGCLLADRYNKFAFFYDTGTGKTVMALDIINSKYQKDGTKFLIIAPKAIIQTAWLEDARKFYPEMRILPLTVSFKENKRKKLLDQWKMPDRANTENLLSNRKDNYLEFLAMLTGNESEFDKDEIKDERTLDDMVQHYIINAELFIRNPLKYIEDLGVEGLVVDESAVMKNHQSTTSSTIIAAASKMKYVYLLSGKPAPNNELEYFSQMKAVDPDMFCMSYSRFANDFGVNDYQKNICLDNDAKNTLSKLIAARSLIVSKEDCLDLPETIEIVHQFELPDDIMQEYDELYANCLAVIKGMDHSTRFYTPASKLAVLMKLRQMTSGFFILNSHDGDKLEREIVPIHENKLKELDDIIDEIGDEQVIIWCQFRYEIKRIEELLLPKGKVVTAFGGTKDIDRNIADFKEGRAKYIIAHPKTLKYGVTFTNCRYAIYYSFSYSAEDYAQSHDRIYRLGQKQKCTFFFLQAENTIDELMYQKVMNKQSNAEFFEWLIKDASEHGIDYNQLKEREDDTYRGVSNDFIYDAIMDDNQLVKDSRLSTNSAWGEITEDSYGKFWIYKKSEAEQEIDDLIELTHLSPDDLKKLHCVISGMLEKFERDYHCELYIQILKYRHCFDLNGFTKIKRTWDEVSRCMKRPIPWVTMKYNSVVRWIKREYYVTLEYIAEVYIERTSPLKNDEVFDQLFDFLAPPDPTEKEIEELELLLDPSNYYSVKERDYVVFTPSGYDKGSVKIAAVNCYTNQFDALQLVLCIDGREVEAVTNFNFENVIVKKGNIRKTYKGSLLKAESENGAISFKIFNLETMPFNIEKGDVLDIYLDISAKIKMIISKKIHFLLEVRDEKSMSIGRDLIVSKECLRPYAIQSSYVDSNYVIMDRRGIKITFVAAFIKNGKICGSLLIENKELMFLDYKVHKVKCGAVIIDCSSDIVSLYTGNKCYMTFTLNQNFVDVTQDAIKIYGSDDGIFDSRIYVTESFRIGKIFDEKYRPSITMVQEKYTEPLCAGIYLKGIGNEYFEITALSETVSDYIVSFDYVGARANGKLLVSFFINGLIISYNRFLVNGKKGEKHTHKLYISKDVCRNNGILPEKVYTAQIEAQFRDKKGTIINTIRKNVGVSLAKWEYADFLDEESNTLMTINSLLLARVYSYWNKIYLVFKIERQDESSDIIDFEIKSCRINGKKVEIDSGRISAQYYGITYEEIRISRGDLFGIDISEREVLDIQYIYNIRKNFDVIKTYSDRKEMVIESNEYNHNNISIYETNEQIIYCEEDMRVTFVAAFINNNDIRWLIKLDNFSKQKREFYIRYARIEGIILQVGFSLISAFPGESSLNLVDYVNPMNISILNKKMEFVADNNKWSSEEKVFYQCNPIIIDKIYDEEYTPYFPKKAISESVELFMPGIYLLNSKVGMLTFDSYEDKIEYLLPRYDLNFKYRPVRMGRVTINLYINGFCIDSETETVNKRENIIITSALAKKRLRWHGINLNETYSFKVQVLVETKERDNLLLEKEYKICISELLAKKKENK